MGEAHSANYISRDSTLVIVDEPRHFPMREHTVCSNTPHTFYNLPQALAAGNSRRVVSSLGHTAVNP